MKKQNLGEYQKLYRLPEHPKMSVHKLDQNGVITLPPGYHKIKIIITDACRQYRHCKWSNAGNIPHVYQCKEIARDDNQISIEISPTRGGLAIRDATVYAFTPFGFPDEKVKILNSERKGKNLILSIPSENSKDRIFKLSQPIK